MTSEPHILLVIGTPIADTFVHALAQRYTDAARTAGAEVRVIDLAHDPIPAHPTARGELRMPRPDRPDDLPLDPVSADYIAAVDRADHLVVFFPQWWGSYPAALKAFIDRVFLSGFAFRYTPGRAWERMLTGRTGRIVMTMDSPRFWNRLVYRNAAETTLSRAIFAYTGIRTRGVTRFGEVRHTSPATRQRWLQQVERHGRTDAARLPVRVDAAVPVG